MNYNFDEIIPRCHTNSLKYDFAAERGMPEDILPLWVADMDFQTPPAVIAALVQSSRHGIFGYSECKTGYFETLARWFADRFNWTIQPEWLVKTPGVVFAIAAAIRGLTQVGDGILIQQPVYYPFAQVIQDNGRQLVVNELLYRDSAYSIDFADFEAKIRECRVKLFILCSPHNPVGRVWTPAELSRLGEICLRHQVLIVSDEIHADFVYTGFKHEVFANLSPEFQASTITCTAPSKTFNLAGLQVSNILIANPEIRQALIREIDRTGFSQLNTMGLVASQVAYATGADWLQALLAYLAENLRFVREFLAARIPRIRLVEPQGTYLLWLDFTDSGLSETDRKHLIVNQAKLWLDAGSMFGAGGEHFERINIACPRQVLAQALQQLEAALSQL